MLRWSHIRKESGSIVTCILVIEDDHELRQMIAEILHHEQYEVIQAPNAAQGIQLGVMYQPDAIVCDWMLPDGSALNILEAFRSQPVLVLSGNVSKGVMDAAYDNGAAHYLRKPFKVNEVLGTIRRMLNPI